MSPHITFDIQVEIIKRLPVKSLIQFRSVCKAWKSLIDSSQFIAGYSVPDTQPQHLLISYRDEEESEVKFVSFVDDDTFPQQKSVPTVPPLVRELNELKVIGSSHGLMCLTCYFGETDDSCPTSEMAVLWNPAIRKYISVAVPNGCSWPDVLDLVHPSFDYVLWPFNYVIGFGVCPVTNDPKLVKITYINDCRRNESISCIPCQVMVFTLSSRKWTTSCTNMPRKSIEFTYFQTVIGQFIYWLAYDWIVVDCKYRALMISFDMSTDEFREVDVPDSLAYAPELHMSVSRLKESLVLLDYNYRETTKNFVCGVWMMEHGDSRVFTKLFTINAPNVSVLQTLGFRNSGEPIVEMKDDSLDSVAPCALVVYEPCSEHIRDLGICGNMFSFFGSSYTESLLLLDHDDGQIIRC